MTFYEFLAIAALITFIIYTGFTISYLMDLKKTSRAIRQFTARTEERLIPAIADLNLTLQRLRKVADDISSVSETVRAAAGAVISVQKAVENLYGYYRENFTRAAEANLSAVKAGVKAGVVQLVSNLKTRKEGRHA
jgi:uncharacterized protein YoxC